MQPTQDDADASPRVLVVEDDERIVDVVARVLRRAGFDPRCCGSGQDALAILAAEDVDVVVLDITIPPPDGLAVLRRLRKRGDDVPVLLLSGRSDVSERVAGLEAGADDYLAKPFALVELVARVRALVRRHERVRTAPLEVGDVVLDLEARTVQRAGQDVELSPREFDLLALFLRNPDQALPRSLIRDRVWGEADDDGSNIVDVYVRYLREKLDRPFDRRSLRTVRGVGYRWDPRD